MENIILHSLIYTCVSIEGKLHDAYEFYSEEEERAVLLLESSIKPLGSPTRLHDGTILNACIEECDRDGNLEGRIFLLQAVFEDGETCLGAESRIIEFGI